MSAYDDAVAYLDAEVHPRCDYEIYSDIRDIVDEIEAENARLRELVRDYHRFADAICAERDCDGCSQRDEGACERGVLTSRECVLGIEVDE